MFVLQAVFVALLAVHCRSEDGDCPITGGDSCGDAPLPEAAPHQEVLTTTSTTTTTTINNNNDDAAGDPTQQQENKTPQDGEQQQEKHHFPQTTADEKTQQDEGVSEQQQQQQQRGNSDDDDNNNNDEGSDNKNINDNANQNPPPVQPEHSKEELPKSQSGPRDPYLVMQVSRDASQSEIRKVYRHLSLLYHPDRNSNDPTAGARFEEINAAFEILGDPDKRAIYDDFGHDHKGFDHHWQFEQSKAQGSSDFYNGHNMIHKLNHENWDARMRGKGYWLVEFYAPWCVHCQQSTDAWKQAASRLDGEVEFGAVNIANNRELQERFKITHIPKFFMFSPEHDVQAEFHWNGHHTLASDMPPWVRDVATEWDRLFSRTHITVLNGEIFEESVKTSKDAWMVMFTSRKCSLCSDVKPNWYRLSMDVVGLAQMGTVDCTSHPDLCRAEGVDTNKLPQFFAYIRGDKSGKNPENLFSAEEISSHLALPLIGKVLKMALSSEVLRDDAVALPAEDFDYQNNDKKEPPPPPPPSPPPYRAPPPKPVFPELPAADRNRPPQIGQA